MRISFVIIAILIELTALSVSADPLPAPEPENGFSVMQTFETAFHHESPIAGDTLGTFIIYAGPSLARVWLPEEVAGNGMGIEIGVGFRIFGNDPYEISDGYLDGKDHLQNQNQCIQYYYNGYAEKTMRSR